MTHLAKEKNNRLKTNCSSQNKSRVIRPKSSPNLICGFEIVKRRTMMMQGQTDISLVLQNKKTINFQPILIILMPKLMKRINKRSQITLTIPTPNSKDKFRQGVDKGQLKGQKFSKRFQSRK